MTDTPRPPAKRGRRKTHGFGFDPDRSPYHFAVVPDGKNVTIVERFAWGDGPAADAPAETPKATLSDYLWGRVAEAVAAEFNGRLRAADLPAGAWAKRETVLAPHLGKELTLLAWAVEDADPTVIPAMIANWSGLAPEERWWFYTTINATSSHAGFGKDKGWRKAIKIAFAENPVQLPSSALLVGPMPEPKPKARRAASARKPPAPADDITQGRLGLWGDEDPIA